MKTLFLCLENDCIQTLAENNYSVNGRRDHFRMFKCANKKKSEDSQGAVSEEDPPVGFASLSVT